MFETIPFVAHAERAGRAPGDGMGWDECRSGCSNLRWSDAYHPGTNSQREGCRCAQGSEVSRIDGLFALRVALAEKL